MPEPHGADRGHRTAPPRWDDHLPLLPESTIDDTDVGEPPPPAGADGLGPVGHQRSSDDERILREIPPHHVDHLF